MLSRIIAMRCSSSESESERPLLMQEKRCTRREVIFARSTLQAAYNSAVFHRQNLT
jgi:hypothetical protein